MKTTVLGRTGMRISKLCLGCMSYGSSTWRPWVLDENQARPFFKRALEAGINFFDTADIYSLGATMYEMLNGNPPFYRGDVNYQILNEQPEKIEGVSETVNTILQKTLAKEYENRYRSCEEMLEAVEGKKGIIKKVL